MKAVSEELLYIIKDLMKEDLLKQFSLGGGTNLALKYNHRVSTDIDLFSSNIVGVDKINEINALLEDKYKGLKISSNVENKSINHLAFVKANLEFNGVNIKIDIIQNMGLNHPVETIDNVRLINDLDIGALKLLSASDRGNRKDFYDIYLLSKKHGLNNLYEELLKRNKLFDVNKTEHQNIFNIPSFKPKDRLDKSITKLGDFNNGNDLKKPGNKIIFNRNSPVLKSWVEVKKELNSMFIKLSKDKNVEYKPTKNLRVGKNRGFSL